MCESVCVFLVGLVFLSKGSCSVGADFHTHKILAHTHTLTHYCVCLLLCWLARGKDNFAHLSRAESSTAQV